jgi:hypothetical protein
MKIKPIHSIKCNGVAYYGENIVARWNLDDEETDTKEDLQLDNQLINLP